MNYQSNYQKAFAAEQGFTLLEVLIALVIFAITAVMLYNQINSSMTSAERIEQKYLALTLVKNRFSEMMIDRKLYPVGETADVVEMGFREWEVVTQVNETPNENLRRVVVSIYEPDDDSREYAVLSMTRFIGEY